MRSSSSETTGHSPVFFSGRKRPLSLTGRQPSPLFSGRKRPLTLLGRQRPFSLALAFGRLPKVRVRFKYASRCARTVRQYFNGPLASSSMGGARGPSNFAHCSYSRERSVELSAPPAPPPASFRFKVIAKWDNPAFQPWFKFVSDSSLYSTLWAIPASPSDETKR